MVREAIKRIPLNTAMGCDFWEAINLRRLSDEALDALANLLNTIEKEVAWPHQMLFNMVVLMGKPTGGCRPIALMPMLYRIWTKVRKPDMQQWEAAHVGKWDAAVKGSSALRAAVAGAFMDELASYSGEDVLTILWDLEKFYDNIDILRLIDRACEMEYPIIALALGVQMHMGPRVLKAYGAYIM